MIDPVLFTIRLFGLELSVHWYGVIIAAAVLVGAFLAERQITRRGGDETFIWDLLILVVPAGIIGARAWYVINDLAGGGQYFRQFPAHVFYVWNGGLHIYGAVLFGLVTAWWYARRHDFDFWVLLDSLAPVLLISQAIGRLGNFINQELYGPPTDLPWGVSIAADYRIAPWTDLEAFPVETTRFHPTFFYEMIWNLIAAAVILWMVRKFASRMKPGTAFYMWLVFEGVGRAWLEFFRPDQPVIPGTGLSYSRLIALLMALIGVLLLLVRYEKIKLPFLKPGPEAYKTKGTNLKWKAKKAAK